MQRFLGSHKFFSAVLQKLYEDARLQCRVHVDRAENRWLNHRSGAPSGLEHAVNFHPRCQEAILTTRLSGKLVCSHLRADNHVFPLCSFRFDECGVLLRRAADNLGRLVDNTLIDIRHGQDSRDVF